MKILEVTPLAIPDVKVIKCARFGDNRGYFTEPFRNSDFQKIIPDFSILQVNESYSNRGVVRGLHIQWNPYMGKLVRSVKGHMVDLFLDIRKGSPTYGKIAAYDMPVSPKNDYFEWIWIPVGFAHGNYYLEETIIEYFCTSEYSPGCETGISPLSKDLDWSLCDKNIKSQFDQLIQEGLTISEKDQKGFALKEWEKNENAKRFVI